MSPPLALEPHAAAAAAHGVEIALLAEIVHHFGQMMP
jgi:hypothetical protein